MAPNNSQRKSSSFSSVFGLFKSKKGKGGHESHDQVTKPWRPCDEDTGLWGVAEPGIDRKAEAFIAHYKKRFFESQLIQLDPAAAAEQE